MITDVLRIEFSPPDPFDLVAAFENNPLHRERCLAAEVVGRHRIGARPKMDVPGVRLAGRRGDNLFAVINPCLAHEQKTVPPDNSANKKQRKMALDNAPSGSFLSYHSLAICPTSGFTLFYQTLGFYSRVSLRSSALKFPLYDQKVQDYSALII